MTEWRREVSKVFDKLNVFEEFRDVASPKARRFLDELDVYRNNDAVEDVSEWQSAAIEYKPLPFDARQSHFRLLRILNRQTNGRIECELKYRCVDSAPPYQALSYCWGSAERNVPIVCNGTEILVSSNLAAALSRLRIRGSKYIWVDALCINQKDLLERQEQVQIMQHIYQQADEVCVWLGSENRIVPLRGFSKIAFRGLQSHAQPSKYGDATATGGYNFALGDDGVGEFRLALRSILQRPWFDRIWCVQEVLMNSKATLICSANEISWKDFQKGLAAAVRSEISNDVYVSRDLTVDSVLSERLEGLAKYENPQHGDTAASYLLRLLIRYRSKLSTDPRDKVYALFGLVKHFFAEFNLRPSYEVSAAEAYRRAAVYILQSTRKLHLFASCGCIASSTQNNLPSWVPDWSCADNLPEVFQHAGSTNMQSFCSSLESKVRVNEFCEGRILNLQGQIFDEVEEVGDILPVGTLRQIGYETDNRWWLDLAKQSFLVEADDGARNYSRDFGMTMVRKLTKGTSLDIMQSTFHSDEPNHDDEVGTLAELKDAVLRERRKLIIRQLQACLRWKAIAQGRSTRCRYTDRKDRDGAYWRTLCAGKLSDNRDTALAVYRKWNDSLKLLSSCVEDNPLDWETTSLSFIAKERQLAKVEKYWKAWQRSSRYESVQLLKYAYNRRLARTSKGSYCLVPATTKTGDMIGIFLGSDTPLVIREYGEDWQMVGQCYVDGSMHGETYKGKDSCKTYRFC